MEWFLWVLVAVVLGVAAVIGSGRLGEMPPAVHDAPVPELPEGELTASDLANVQFAVVPRGYSMAQVDELLDRLAAQLHASAGGPSAPGLPDDLGSSAIMVGNEHVREAEHGSNEATHG